MKSFSEIKVTETSPMIPFPSRRECLALMEAQGMLSHIREHSFLVMEVANFLGQALRNAGFELYLPLIEAGALLHDLGKTPCLGTSENHARWGSAVLSGLGYLEVAQIVKEHVRLEPSPGDTRPLREAEVVNYADKRVLHTRVVTLKERFLDLKERYGRTPEALQRVTAMELHTQALEEKLFAPLRLTPLDLLDENSYKQSAFSGQQRLSIGESH